MSSYLNRFTLLKKIPIFQHLNWFELNRIARHSSIIEYNKGDLICQQGNPADAFYCLVSGRVHCYTATAQGNKEHTELIYRGMYFGVISALTGENHSQSFEALNDCVILKINKEDFKDILKSTPKLGAELSQSLSKQVRSHITNAKNNFDNSIISVYSPQLGSGTSTYAVNLAFNLEKETGRNVLLIHLLSKDIQENQKAEDFGHASPKWRAPSISLNDLHHDPDKIMDHICKGQLKIDLLNIAVDFNDKSILNKIGQFISAPINFYHYIILDLPNENNDLVLKTLAQSDIIHLVCANRLENVDSSLLFLDHLKSYLGSQFKQENIQLIIVDTNPQESLSFEGLKKKLQINPFVFLPHIKQEELTVAIVSGEMTVIAADIKSEYSKTVVRIARKISGVLVGLVLGGGAALGVAHIGVIRVLERENIPVDIVIGSSMGALIGGIWSIGKTADELETVAREFEKKAALFKLLDPVIPVGGLIAGHAIKRWLKKHLGNSTFHDTKFPLLIVAYDLLHRHDLILEHGLIYEAVRRSVSIPGVIEPVQENNQLIIDGGVLNPLPTNILRSLGVKKIIAVNVLQSPSQASAGYELEQRTMQNQAKIPFLTAPFHYVMFRLNRLFVKLFTPNISDIIVRTLQATEYEIAKASSQNADILIEPDLVGIQWFELSKVDELLKRGEEATLKQLPAIKQLIKE